MESAAREINLTDIAERVEKIIVEAAHIRERLEQCGDTLRGAGGKPDTNGTNMPQPMGLVPLIGQRLAVIESIQHEQRQALNRIAEGLCESPPPTPIGSSLGHEQAKAMSAGGGRRY